MNEVEAGQTAEERERDWIGKRNGCGGVYAREVFDLVLRAF